jgi:capsular polysaccharide biosynthesis protein
VNAANSDFLKRRIWIFALCGLLGAVGGYLNEQRKGTQYTDSAVILFGANESLSQFLGLTDVTSDQEAATTTATDVQLLSLPVIAAAANRSLHRSGSGIPVSVAEEGASNLVDVTATSPSPGQAARFANAYARAFISYTQSQQTSTLRAAISGLRKEIQNEKVGGVAISQIATAQATLAQLQSIAAASPVNVSLADVASPGGATTSSKDVTDGLIGLVIGLVIGLGIALAAKQLDPRLRSLSDLPSGEPVTLIAIQDSLPTLAARRGPEPPGQLSTRIALRPIVDVLSETDNPCALAALSWEPKMADKRLALALALDLVALTDSRAPGAAAVVLLSSEPAAPEDLAVLEGSAPVSITEHSYEYELRRLDPTHDRAIDIVTLSADIAARDLGVALANIGTGHDLMVVLLGPRAPAALSDGVLRRADASVGLLRLNGSRKTDALRLWERLKLGSTHARFLVGLRAE